LPEIPIDTDIPKEKKEDDEDSAKKKIILKLQ
jgi:hypothetical protein